MGKIKDNLLHIIITACLSSVIIYDFYFPHIKKNLNPWIFNDDTRQHIAPLYSYYDNTLFRDDYISQVFRESFLPPLYKGLFKLTSLAWSPEMVSVWISYILIFIFIIFLSLSAKDIAGWTGFYMTVLLVSTNCLYLERIVGGIARNFSLPILSIAMWALFKNKPFVICFLIILSATIYPFITPLLFAVLLCSLFLDKEQIDWSNKKKLLVTLATVVLTLIAIAPQLVGVLGQGGYIFNVKSSHPINVNSEGNIFSTLIMFCGACASLNGYLIGKVGFNLIFIILTLYVLIQYALSNKNAKKLLVFVLISLSAIILSRDIFRDIMLTQRLLIYPLIVFTPLVLMYSVKFCLEVPDKINFKNKDQIKRLISFALVSLSMFWAFEGSYRFSSRCGLVKKIKNNEREIYKRISTLSKDALIAGWPSGIIDSVPLLSRRKAFLTKETDRNLMKSFTAEMRDRMKALTDAYFAQDVKPIIDLNTKHKVDYLIVNLKYFTEAPKSHKKVYIKHLEDKFKQSNFLLPKIIDNYKAYSKDNYVIVDLNKFTQHFAQNQE